MPFPSTPDVTRPPEDQLQVLRHLYGEGRTYHIRTFGCQQNENDSEKIAGILDACGMLPVPSPDNADLIVLNTCSVRENADDRLFGNLGRLKNQYRDRPGRIVALCGCMMRQERHVEKVRRSYPFVDLVFGPSDIHLLPAILLRRLTEGKKVFQVGDEDTIAEGLPIHRNRRYRALCSIMYGCNNFCTYCIVPYVRGRERSRPAGAILEELKGLAAQGFREVLLLGQNVNSYGRDLGEGAPDFSDLLAMAAGIPGFAVIRYMTSHPKDLSHRLIDVVAAHPVIESHLHLPLQAGSDRVLREMNRGYTRADYQAIAAYARGRIPGLTISTDLIVGFPGETEEDFQATLDVMDRVRFDSAFTFHYSPREGTPAASRTDQVAPDVIGDRFRRLVENQDAHSLASNEATVGTIQRVLIEGASSRPGIYTGRTTHNRLVNFSLPEETLIRLSPEQLETGLENQMADIRIHRAHAYYLDGVIEGVPE